MITQLQITQTPKARNFSPPMRHGLMQRGCAAGEALGSSRKSEGFIGLQRIIGNQNMVNLYHQHNIQTKLSVSHPNDIYEKEADRVADQVMRMPEHVAQAKLDCPCASGSNNGYEEIIQSKPLAITPLVQRKEDEEEEEKIQTKSETVQDTFLIQRQAEDKEKEEEAILHTKMNSGRTFKTSPQFEHSLQSMRSGGQPLDQATRAYFEPRFGVDFGDVRVHTNEEASKAARTIHAQAYTLGQNIVFDEGRYSPESDSGKKLIAHELTHTLQQSQDGFSSLAGPVNRSNHKDVKERKVEAFTERDGRPGCNGRVTLNIHSATSSVQRRGDITKVPKGLDCEIASDTAKSNVDNILFPNGAYNLSTLQKFQIHKFIMSWQAVGANAPVRVDGYASTSGTDEFNWRLSCNRAMEVASELVSPSSKIIGIPVGLIRTVAQGETAEFGSEADNRRATISSPIDVPFPNLPPSVLPENPPGPEKPPDTPFLFCTPFPNKILALDSWLKIYAAMMVFTSRFGPEVRALWRTYLRNPKSGTRGTLLPRRVFDVPTSRVVKEFREDTETVTQTKIIMDLLSKAVKENPALVPHPGQTTPKMRFESVLPRSKLHDLDMTFTDGDKKIPGNIAGGPGKDASDAGDDVRNVDGQFSVENLGFTKFKIMADFFFDIQDCVDFCPGDPGGWIAESVTIPMSMFEATPDFPTYDVPFEVKYNLHDEGIY
jgi:outer membrane protein OmpA-like peptidoglycan-associated protein